MNDNEILTKIKSVLLLLLAHPDNEPESEFADRIDNLIDIKNELNEREMTSKQKYIAGKSYMYSEIPKEDTEEYTVSEYGLDYIGQHAIHIRYYKGKQDVWFIWDSQANEGIFKCVYNQ